MISSLPNKINDQEGIEKFKLKMEKVAAGWRLDIKVLYLCACVARGLVIAGWSMDPADKILIHKLMMLRIADQARHHQTGIRSLHCWFPSSLAAATIHSRLPLSNSPCACILSPGVSINNPNFPILDTFDTRPYWRKRWQTFDWEMTGVDWPFMDTITIYYHMLVTFICDVIDFIF